MGTRQERRKMIASFSFLNTWAICPHQAARRYIIKDLPRQEESKEMAWGNEVHRAMEQRLGPSKIKLPENMPYESFCAPIERRLDTTWVRCTPELKLGITKEGRTCDFFADDVWLRGVLDAPIETSQSALLLDWKTGKKREDPYELEIGALLLQARAPHLTKLLGQYVWLKSLELGEVHDLSHTDRTWQRVQATMEEVALGRYLKTPGPLCGVDKKTGRPFCQVLDCQFNKGRK